MPRTWNPRWKIGVAAIDAQHEALFDRFDAFIETASAGARITASNEALAFLSRYVDEHFGDEERAMAEAAYPGLEEQRELHRTFVQELAGLSARFREGGPTPTFLLDLANLFECWLTLHITRVDQRFAEFLRARGGGA